MALQAKIYMDTNVLRYFGTAFAASPMDEELRNRLLLPPISVLELLSQLATDAAPEVLASIQAMLRVFNPQRTGVLPWSDDFIRMAVFSAPLREGNVTGSLNNAINNCLNAECADDLVADAREVRTLLDVTKTRTTDQFAAVLQGWRAEGRLSEHNDTVVLAKSIARRAHVQP